MITDRFNPACYTQTNRIALALYHRNGEALAERWQDEASEFALAGNPNRARYIEGFIENWARRVP